MNEFFASIRADLTDRRLLPLVALVGACLVAAVAYALLGGSGGSGATGGTANVPTVTPPAGIAVTGATPEHAVAETTDGFKEQSSGKARNPFDALPGAAAASAASSSAGTAGGSSSSAGGSGESSGSSKESGEEGSSESKGEGNTETKKKPQAPKTVYDVAIEFGTLPPGITPETAQLTPFTKLKLQTPLPNPQTTVIVFRGVTAKGKSASFQLAAPAFPSGTGACLPSAVQCEVVDLKPGETEQFVLYAADGSSTTYELRVLTIKEEKTGKGNAKSAKAAWAESRAGAALLRRAGLMAMPFLHYSSQPGVLVFGSHKAHTARAHGASSRPAR